MKRNIHLIIPRGPFHADDVLCAAMAQAIGDHPWIERRNSAQYEETRNCYFTVDGHKYDPNRSDAPVRADGSKYAACGLLYEEWKNDLFNTKAGQQYFENMYIRPIEMAIHDKKPNMLSHMIDGLTPTGDDNVSLDRAFDHAVERMQTILEAERHRMNDLGKTEPALDNKILTAAQKIMGTGEFWDASSRNESLNNYMALQEDMYNGQAKDPLTAGLSAISEMNPEAAKKMVTAIIDEDRKNVNYAHRMRAMVQYAYDQSTDKTGIVLPSDILSTEADKPWINVLPNTEAEYVVYKIKFNANTLMEYHRYRLECVPKNLETNERKAKLPETWLTDKPKNCNFMAKSGDYCSFGRLEDAKAALEEALAERSFQQRKAGNMENADYHMFRNNSDVTIQYGDNAILVPPGAWYGWDQRTGEGMVWLPDKQNAKWYEKNNVTNEKQDFDCGLKQNGTWVRCHRSTGEWLNDTVDLSRSVVKADGITSLGIKSFDEWLKDCYGLSKEKYEKCYYGPQAQNIIDRYKLYAYGPLPEFANTQENLRRVPVPDTNQPERTDNLIGTHDGAFQDIAESMVLTHGDGHNNRDAFLNAANKMQELYQQEIQEVRMLDGAVRTSYLPEKAWNEMSQIHSAVTKALQDPECNNGYLPENLRDLVNQALEGHWTVEMAEINRAAVAYLNGQDNNGAPWVDPTIVADDLIRRASDFGDDYHYNAKEYETIRSRASDVCLHEEDMIVNALVSGQKDLYIKAREAGIDREFCAQNMIWIDCSDVDKWEHEFQTKEDITYE